MMKTRTPRPAAIVSLALCVIALVAWAASYARPARFVVDRAAVHRDSIETGSEWAWRISSADGMLDIATIGSFYQWTIAYWKIVLALLLLPGRWIQLRLRDRRQRVLAGHCRNCGYDLRASIDRCPECGEAIPQIAEAAA